MARTAAALVIGNEVLSGKIQDTNSHDLARFLRRHGVELRRIVTVPDEPEVIIDALRALRASGVDWIFTSGGIGPTHDDVTIESVARALDRSVRSHPALAEALRAHFGERCTEAHLRMANTVEGTALHVGDPPAIWPAMQVDNVFVLPGIPQLFRVHLDLVSHVVRAGEGAFVTAAVLCRCDEPSITARIDQVVAAHPAIAIGSYPRWTDDNDASSAGDERAYSVKITFDGRDPGAVNAAAEQFAALLEPDAIVAIVRA